MRLRPINSAGLPASSDPRMVPTSALATVNPQLTAAELEYLT